MLNSIKFLFSFSILLFTSICFSNDGIPIEAGRIQMELTSEDSDSSPEEGSSVEVTGEAVTQQAQVKSQNINYLSYLFNLDSSLDLSLGVEIVNGETFLIIEMDHNPSRNEFVFGFNYVAPHQQHVSVQLDNAPFGFKNKISAKLPMLEMEAQDSSHTKFIKDAQNSRTTQRVNMSKIVRRLSDAFGLIDRDGTHYMDSDIDSLSILMTKPLSNESKINNVHEIKITIPGLTEGQIHQIHGTKLLSDLNEQTKYSVGATIIVKPNYKIPNAPVGAQWVLIPKRNETKDLTYKLIQDPKIGDEFSISTFAENILGALPSLEGNLVWTKVRTTAKKSIYKIVAQKEKLSPSVLLRYTNNVLRQIPTDVKSGITLEDAIKKAMQSSPILYLESRLPEITATIAQANSISEVVGKLLAEQELYFKFKAQEQQTTTSQANMCSSFLN